MIGKSRKKNIDNAANISNDEKSINKKQTKSLLLEKAKSSELQTFVDNEIKKDSQVIKSTNSIKIKPKKIFLVLFLFIIIVLGSLTVIKFVDFGISEVIWKTSVAKGSDDVNNKSIKYSGFKNGMMRISNDGITYIDKNGGLKWTISYNMKNVIYDGNDTYFVVADKNGSEFIIFDENGMVSKNNVTYSLKKVCMANDGSIYTLEEGEEVCKVKSYDIDGENRKYEVDFDYVKDGVPVDLTITENGSIFAVGTTFVSDNTLNGKVMIYSVDTTNNVVTKKCEYEKDLVDKYLARIHFFDKNRLLLVHDSGLMVLYVDNEGNVESNKNILFENRMRSISYNSDNITIVFANNKVETYNKNGDLVSFFNIDFGYSNFYLKGNEIFFINEKRVIVYDIAGIKIFDKEMMSNVAYASKRKNMFLSELLVGLVDGVECIRFY